MDDTIVWRKSSSKATPSSSLPPKEVRELLADDVPQLQYLPPTIQTKIAQGRSAKGMSQKQLAQQLNVKPDVIKQLETSRIYPFNRNFIRKVEQTLNTKVM